MRLPFQSVTLGSLPDKLLTPRSGTFLQPLPRRLIVIHRYPVNQIEENSALFLTAKLFQFFDTLTAIASTRGKPNCSLLNRNRETPYHYHNYSRSSPGRRYGMPAIKNSRLAPLQSSLEPHKRRSEKYAPPRSQKKHQVKRASFPAGSKSIRPAIPITTR